MISANKHIDDTFYMMCDNKSTENGTNSVQPKAFR